MKQSLLSVMIKNGDRQSDLANALGISQPALNSRINGHVDFRLNELRAIRKRYGLSADEMWVIFFAPQVSN